MSENLFKSLDRDLSIKSPRNNSMNISANKISSDINKVKYIDSNQLNFKDFYSTGNKMYQNYDIDSQNDLTYGYDTRRHSNTKNTGMMPIENIKESLVCKDGICSLPPKKTHTGNSASDSRSSSRSSSSVSSIGSSTNSRSKNQIKENQLPMKVTTNNRQDLNIIDIINTDSNLKLGNEQIQINLNNLSRSAAKVPSSSKESEIYWNNTRRRNLDTAVYIDNPSKIGGRGFGDIPKYDLLLNGIGLSTRQDDPDIKPQNVDNDRIFLTNQNYNYAKFHVSENLECGADTRYLNKKMIN